MASEQTLLNILGRALWDPRPTRTDRQSQQLAFALGYPEGWRVVRTVEAKKKNVVKSSQSNNNDHVNEIMDTKIGEKYVGPENLTTGEETSQDVKIAEQTDIIQRPADESTLQEDRVVPTNETSIDTPHPTVPELSEPFPEPDFLIEDRIYAGEPGTGCDMWFHHAAAMKAAESWNDGKTEDVNLNTTKNQKKQENEISTRVSTPFDHKGGHLLPRQPLYNKGDKVQAFYENNWWDAKITRRKGENPVHGFIYSVQYSADNTKQSGVTEAFIRPRPQAPDPRKVAEELGFGPGWQALSAGHNRWNITSPTGEKFSNKKRALELFRATKKAIDTDNVANASTAVAVGDPPWRTTGNEYLGRKVFWTTLHKASARRTVSVEQIGTVVGWISETDVDKTGQPGFVSEKSGQPARLYNVVFEYDPNNPYAYHLIQSQDMEEEELIENLIPIEDLPPKKKLRKH